MYVGKHFDKGYGRSFYIEGGFSLIQGISLSEFSIEDGSLYTAPDGEYLDLAYDANIRQANIGAVSATDFNGFGTAFGLKLGYHFYDHHVMLSVQDVGFINWNSSSNLYSGDSAFRYEGVIVDDIFNLTSNPISGFNQDSLLSLLNLTETTSSFTRSIPATIDLTYRRFFDNQIEIIARARYRSLRRYLPYFTFSTGRRWELSRSVIIPKVTIGYGGYGLFTLGPELKWYNEHVSLEVGSENVLGFIAPNTFTGSSLFLRFRTFFGG